MGRDEKELKQGGKLQSGVTQALFRVEMGTGGVGGPCCFPLGGFEQVFQVR